jgi:hypothetical protein
LPASASQPAPLPLVAPLRLLVVAWHLWAPPYSFVPLSPCFFPPSPPRVSPHRCHHYFKIDEPNNQNHSNQVTIPAPPTEESVGFVPNHSKPWHPMPIHPGLISCRTLLAWPIKQPLPLSHLVYKSLCPTPDLFAHKIIAKWRKRPHSCKPPPCSPRSYIAGSEAITEPQPSTDKTK